MKRSATTGTAPALALASLALLLTACTQAVNGVAGDDLFGTASISDGAHGGNEHFFFLPPLVPDPAATGTFDATVDPVVEVLEAGVAIATWTEITASASDEHYRVNWHTNELTLDDELDYRIVVTVDGVELGYADVDVVNSGKDLKDLAGDYVALIDGRTLPIKFRIEEGALPLQRVLAMKGHDRAPFPPLQLEVTRNRAVVLVHPTIAVAPLIELGA